jgi:hypothetical protein
MTLAEISHITNGSRKGSCILDVLSMTNTWTVSKVNEPSQLCDV